jgi:hypothetical protein
MSGPPDLDQTVNGFDREVETAHARAARRSVEAVLRLQQRRPGVTSQLVQPHAPMPAVETEDHRIDDSLFLRTRGPADPDAISVLLDVLAHHRCR